MNKIILFSSLLTDSDFIAYQEHANKKANPSNQNFYSRLVRALASFNKITVISHRPISRQMFSNKSFDSKIFDENEITYRYTRISTNILYKVFSEFKTIYKEALKSVRKNDENNTVILVDVLRYNLLRAAKKLGKKYNIPVIGVLTDNPANLSGVTNKYVNKIFSHALSLDGYISLSDGLINVFNKENRPYYIFEGLVEELNEPKKDPLGNYLFFSGALYERYGVKTMVDAYLASRISHKLIICGSGPLEEYICEKEKSDSRILYLSQLERNKILSMQRYALANINPRPINAQLDNESIPSKLLEYLSSGVPTISTKHAKLYDKFKDCVLWFEDGNFESLKSCFDSFKNYNYDSLKKMASTARVKVFELYDLRVQGKAITHFVNSLIDSENK